MLKSGTKTRRTQQQIESEKLEEASKKRDIEDKLAQFESMQ